MKEVRNFKTLWDEFLSLGWSGRLENTTSRDILSDIPIAPQTYLRKWRGTWTINYLPIATILEIPAPWVTIWKEFTVWIGGALYELLVESKPSNSIDRFGVRMTQLGTHIERDLCGSRKEWFVDELLPEIIELGTKDFREWMMEEYWEGEDKLGPWIMRNNRYWNDIEV